MNVASVSCSSVNVSVMRGAVKVCCPVILDVQDAALIVQVNHWSIIPVVN